MFLTFDIKGFLCDIFDTFDEHFNISTLNNDIF